MFCAIALGALRGPLELIYVLMCTTRVLRWDSKKLQKQLRINSLGHFLGTRLGDQSGRGAFPCSMALVFSFSEAFSYSVAIVFRFSDFRKMTVWECAGLIGYQDEKDESSW